ncbi:hypothetical protein TNCT_388321 [Trichonephila clavata]|uniref:Uncharacterized protein n=1 Tax=Trichonephila clavata TaxID=2740835 RepID=A0A8X6F501_TRICU|nr:hypothetical protein TNCT_388321 [Trichonephila clavata]
MPHRDYCLQVAGQNECGNAVRSGTSGLLNVSKDQNNSEKSSAWDVGGGTCSSFVHFLLYQRVVVTSAWSMPR